MPGPLPKDPAQRQRRNKEATRALLPPEDEPITSVPRLPTNPLGKWHKLTRLWWKDVWASPQSSEFLRSDLGALFRLAMLVDMFWTSGKLNIAAEIRMMEQQFGLTPMARRRLQWTVTQAEDAADKRERGRARGARMLENDPRGILK